MRIHALGFDMNGDVLCIVCRHVSEGKPIVVVAHDLDGVVQMMCGLSNHGAADAHTVHLHHMAEKLSALNLPTIQPGQYAELSEGGWNVADIPPEEEEA